MSENRVLSERYSELAMRLCSEEPLLAHIFGSNATICFLSSDLAKKSKGRLVYGECEKVPAKLRWAVPCDFTITVYEPNCEGMDDDRISRLLFHELLHVGIEVGDDGAERYFVRPHDLEDFRACVDRWGADWLAV